MFLKTYPTGILDAGNWTRFNSDLAPYLKLAIAAALQICVHVFCEIYHFRNMISFYENGDVIRCSRGVLYKHYLFPKVVW